VSLVGSRNPVAVEARLVEHSGVRALVRTSPGPATVTPAGPAPGVCRVRARYPSQVRMSDRMLSWYEEGHDRRSCYWGSGVLHFDVAWRKKACVGQGNCAECGCLGGAVGSPVRKLLDPAALLRALS